MASLFFPFSPFHRFRRSNDDLVTAFRTDVGFAAGTGETVAARFGKLSFIPRISTMGAGYE